MAPSTDPQLDEMISAWIKSNKDPKYLHPNNMDNLVKRLRAWVVRAKEHREKHYTSTAAMQANQLEMIGLMKAPITSRIFAQKPAMRQKVVDIMRGMQVNFQDLIWNYLLTVYHRTLTRKHMVMLFKRIISMTASDTSVFFGPTPQSFNRFGIISAPSLALSTLPSTPTPRWPISRTLRVMKSSR